MSSTKFVIFGPIGKTRWPPWPMIGWDIFDFSSETAERNSTILDRKQDLNVLYQVCVFRADRKNKMAALASDWLRHFRLLLWNRWTEYKETWQEARSQCLLTSLCFSGWWVKKNSVLADLSKRRHIVLRCTIFGPLGLLFWLLLWNCWMEFNETWQESRSKRPLPSLCFSGRSEKQDGRPGLWLAETFSTSLKLLNRIQLNLIGSKISTPSTKFVFFGPIGKTKWPTWPLIGWDIFVLSSETVKGIRRNLIGSKISTPSPSLCFSGGSEKQNGRPGLWFAETFSTFPLKPLNRIQQNLTGSKISTSSTRLAFFGLIQKQYGRPCLWLAETYFDFSSETAERNSAKLDRKQDLNVLYQVCLFPAEKWIKIATLANPSKVAHCTQVHIMGPFGPLVCEFI